MNILFKTKETTQEITIGKVVYTKFDKYYLVFDILNDNMFVAVNFYNHKEQAAIIELNDVIEVIELPKNVKSIFIKKCEKAVDNYFERN